MSLPTLLFIADISGYTRFVNSTENRHSRHIIAELLELIIDEDELDMIVSEIEGDAIFFYKSGGLPSFSDVLVQVKKMFIRFHEHLRNYESRRICQCGACSTASQMDLKFLIHAGEIDFLKIKGRESAYGPEVILAHRLMKNNVPMHDYAMLTNQFLELADGRTEPLPDWVKLQHGVESYENYEDVKYCYVPLAILMNQVKVQPPIPTGLKVENPLRNQIQIGGDVIDVFEVVSNLEFRTELNEVDVDFDLNEKLNRQGTVHKCIIGGRELEFETVKAEFEGKNWVLGETLKNPPFGIQEMVSYSVVEPDENGSKLTVELHAKFHPLFGWALKPFIKRQLKKNLYSFAERAKKLVEKQLKKGAEMAAP